MSPDQRTGRRLVLPAATGVLAATGLTLLVGAGLADGPEPARTPAAVISAPPATPPTLGPDTPVPGPGAARAATPVDVPPPPDFGPVLPASAPLTVASAAIGLEHTALVPLAVGPDGVLAAPAEYADPGWHVAGPDPGQLGPAVIAGHVDGPDGPAVFHRLAEIRTGDTVDVVRQDGTTATFTVDTVERYAKDQFPTSRVYGNTTDRAELRLITCGGEFDRSTGHYVDNVVVFAHLTGASG